MLICYRRGMRTKIRVIRKYESWKLITRISDAVYKRHGCQNLRDEYKQAKGRFKDSPNSVNGG